MKVVKLEDVMMIKELAEKLIDKSEKLSNGGPKTNLTLSPYHLDRIANRLIEKAFEVDDPK